MHAQLRNAGFLSLDYVNCNKMIIVGTRMNPNRFFSVTINGETELMQL